MHLVDLPMFSWFAHANMENVEFDMAATLPKLKQISLEAQKRLGKIGFPSMHVNVVIKEIKEEHPMAGYGVVPAEAMGAPGAKGQPRDIKYINVNHDLIRDYGNGDSGLDEYVVNMLVHEWAHVYMFNKPKQFAQAVTQLFNQAKNLTYEQLLEMPAPRFNLLKLEIDRKAAQEGFSKVVNDGCESIWNSHESIQLRKSKAGLMQIAKQFFQLYSQYLVDMFTANKRRVGKLAKADITKAAKTLTNQHITSNIKTPNLGLHIPFRVISALIAADDFRRQDTLENDNMRHFATHVSEWPTDYGLFDSDEFWATAMEFFFQLPPNYQKQIIKLISQYR